MNEPYFENLPYIGTLYLQTTYLFFEEPILFLCVDAHGNKFLCLCAEFRDDYRWIVTETDNATLKKMITNELPTYEVFHKSKGKKYIVRWSGYETDKESVALINFDDIPELDLPEKNSFLDISPAQQSTLLKYLQKFSFTFNAPKICDWTTKKHRKIYPNTHFKNKIQSNWTMAKGVVGL